MEWIFTFTGLGWGLAVGFFLGAHFAHARIVATNTQTLKAQVEAHRQQTEHVVDMERRVAEIRSRGQVFPQTEIH